MNGKPQMNRFWIIPASIATRKDLTNDHKMLVGLIISLSNQTGFCWASNEYLAEMIGKNERTIIKYIEFLEDLKILIRAFQVDKEGKEYFRTITILEYENNGPATYDSPGLQRTTATPLQRTTANNINNNRKDNIRNELRTDLKSKKSTSNEQKESNSLPGKIPSKIELELLASDRWVQFLEIWPTSTEKELGTLNNCKKKYWFKLPPDTQEQILQMLREIGTQNLKIITEWKISIFKDGNMNREYLQNYISKAKSIGSNKPKDNLHNVADWNNRPEGKDRSISFD
jgi:hypothetical protein